MTKIKTNYIHKDTLLRIYKMFEKNPDRPFLASDFSINHNKMKETYLDILLKLNLIKKVKVIFFYGKKRKIPHEREGYKLKKIKGGMYDKKSF